MIYIRVQSQLPQIVPKIGTTMMYHHTSFDTSQLWPALVPFIEAIQAKPGQTLVVLTGAFVVGYLIMIMFAPSSYQNVAGPPGSSFVYGE